MSLLEDTMNTDLLGITNHPSKEMSELARRDPGIVDLTIGEPFFGPPPMVLQFLREDIARHADGPWSYAPSAGTAELRRAIAGYIERTAGVEVDPEREILVTNGAAQALWLAVFTTTCPGDDVLLTDPTYMLYERLVLSMGRRPVRVPVAPESGFQLDAATFASAVTPKARALVLDSPGNPTGAILGRECLREIVQTASELGIHVIHDEVMDFTAFPHGHASVLGVAPDLGLVASVNSFSKRFGVPGWRIGWLVAAADVIAQCTKAQTLSTLGCASPLQLSLARALAHPDTDTYLSRRVDQLVTHAEAAKDAWTRIGFPPRSSGGRSGFYLLLDARPFYKARLQHRDDPAGAIGDKVARTLLEEHRVAVVSGTAFGGTVQDCVRISVAGPPHRALDAARRIGSVEPGREGEKAQI
jgi:aspartate/methionine/tyrosine aminotransferase